MKSPVGLDRKRGERNVNLIYIQCKKNEGRGERRGGEGKKVSYQG